MSWFDENQPGSGNLGGARPANPATQSQQPAGQGGDPHAEFMQAVQALGIDPHQLRGNVELMNKVSAYLNQKYPGQNWTNGGTKAGDWFGYGTQGQGLDVLPVGDSHFQTLDDSAYSTAGSGGNPNDPPGFQTGTFTGGGQYPLASVMGTGLAQPWTTPFQAPDPNTFTNDAPFQWQMGQGVNAVTRGLAKNGTLLTGGAMKALDRFGQGTASQYYGDAYNRALGQYNLDLGIFRDNQSILANRLGSMANIGENAAAGTGSLYQDVGNAQAAGATAQGAAAANAANGIGNALGQYVNFRYGNQGQYGGTMAGVGPYNPRMDPTQSSNTNTYE